MSVSNCSVKHPPPGLLPQDAGGPYKPGKVHQFPGQTTRKLSCSPWISMSTIPHLAGVAPMIWVWELPWEWLLPSLLLYIFTSSFKSNTFRISVLICALFSWVQDFSPHIISLNNISWLVNRHAQLSPNMWHYSCSSWPMVRLVWPKTTDRPRGENWLAGYEIRTPKTIDSGFYSLWRWPRPGSNTAGSTGIRVCRYAFLSIAGIGNWPSMQLSHLLLFFFF